MNLYLFILYLHFTCFKFQAFIIVYLSFYLYVYIICCWLWCCGYIPRWVLNHFLDFIWEVPWGGRNLISSRHLGIFMFLFIYIYIYMYVCMYVVTHLISCFSPSPFYFNDIPFNFKHFPIPFTLLSSLLISSFSPIPSYFLGV